MTPGTTSRREKISFGDFQTPQPLAEEICQLLQKRGVVPASVVEPTCGCGNFLVAAAEAFPTAKRILGYELNAEHLAVAAARTRPDASRMGLKRADFFQTDWQAELAELPEPLLVLGNPPWVTNATQGAIGAGNLPVKSNYQGRRGIDAITGQSNFDVSEWIISRLLAACNGRQAAMAMLCKTTVARRLLLVGWQGQTAWRAIELHAIDARAAFGAAVDACLLFASFAPGANCRSAHCFPVAPSLGQRSSPNRIGWRDGRLIANLESYERCRHLCSNSATDTPRDSPRDKPVWRSGIKHDCAAVMELSEHNGELRNKLEEVVDLEPEHLFPLLKSGDIAAGRFTNPRRWLLLPQRFIGEDTRYLEHRAPRTWRYLMSHAARLDARRSSIYRRQPRFAVFGVGEYTFAPWKVVVSGLAKRLQFSVVGPVDNRPRVLDDTSYFLPCQSEREAAAWAKLLNSPAAIEFFSAFVFWDAKRPVTAELLRRLDLQRLASDAHLSERVDRPLDNPKQVRVG